MVSTHKGLLICWQNMPVLPTSSMSCSVYKSMCARAYLPLSPVRPFYVFCCVEFKMQAPNQILRAGPQQIQRAGAPMPVRSAPEPPAYGRPMQQQSQPHNPQPQQPQQYGAPVQSYAPHQFSKVNLSALPLVSGAFRV